MNKRKISFLIVLMSIALLGIIVLQMNWIMHDIRVKEQQFDQGVTLALSDVVNKIETGEVFKVVSDHAWKVTAGPGGVAFNDDSILLDLFAPPPPPAEPQPPQPPVPQENHLHITHRSNGIESETMIRLQHERRTAEHDAIVKEIDNYTDSIGRVASETEEKIRMKMQKLNMVMSKWAYEFGEREENIFSRISPGKLDTIIGEELAAKGISVPYNFGIINLNSDSLMYAKSPEHRHDLLQSPHRIVLFPNDLFSRPDYLLVSFPGRMNYVLSSLWMMLAGSAVFTLIIIFGFAYTIYVIFRQKKLSDIKTDFINNMTHEFKTPIATISLAVDSIRDPRVYTNAEKIGYFTGIIREENKRMNAQVENVLRMAQLEKGELELRHEPVNMHDLIGHSVDFIRLQVSRKEGEIVTLCDATNPWVNGDAFHLANVVNNLLDNANKYSPDKPEILVQTENSENGLLIHVTDKGMGMSAGTQEKIFEKFYRLPTGNIHNIKGFGLGLSYVKAIVEAHKGTVTVKSEAGEGSRFTVYLPIHNPLP